MNNQLLIDDVIGHILLAEGSEYTNDPADPGGPTKFGITLKTLEEYRGHSCTPSDVMMLEVAEAKLIYEKNYATPFIQWVEHEWLFRLAVDSGVQHSVTRVKGWITEIVATTPDPEIIRRKLFSKRLVFYGEITQARPTNVKYIKGWLIRLSNFVR